MLYLSDETLSHTSVEVVTLIIVAPVGRKIHFLYFRQSNSVIVLEHSFGVKYCHCRWKSNRVVVEDEIFGIMQHYLNKRRFQCQKKLVAIVIRSNFDWQGQRDKTAGPSCSEVFDNLTVLQKMCSGVFITKQNTF